MAALPTAVKMHILTALACFDTPSEVAFSVKQQFGLDLSRQRIEAWHPERAAGARLDVVWREVFHATRAKLLAELDRIPIAHKSYRLRKLDQMAGLAEEMGNLPLAVRLIEQAAKEVGGVYERTR